MSIENRKPRRSLKIYATAKAERRHRRHARRRQREFLVFCAWGFIVVLLIVGFFVLMSSDFLSSDVNQIVEGSYTRGQVYRATEF